LSEPAAEGIGSAFGVASQAGAQAPVIIEAAKQAFVDGWVRSMWFGVGLAVVAGVFVALRGPVRADAGGTETTPLLAPVD
jgi:hypothetical protein